MEDINKLNSGWTGAPFSLSNESTKEELLQCLNPMQNIESKIDTPFSEHGKLSLDGSDIVDKNWEKFQLKWVCPVMYDVYSSFANKDIIKSLRDNRWCNVVRLALYTETNDWMTAYCQNETEKERLKKTVEETVKVCNELWMYVIVDWHILYDDSPLTHKEEAKEFFEYISKISRDYDNVIYEICNEPKDIPWEEIKTYANTIIPIIRNNNKDAIIIVGTPNRSQKINIKPEDRIEWENIMYACHFYAASHKEKLRERVVNAKKNWVPIFISEFGICEWNWDWIIDENEANEWFKLIDDYNLSYVAWNLSDYNQTSSLLRSSPEFDKLKESATWNTNDWNTSITITEDNLSENWKIILNHMKWGN